MSSLKEFAKLLKEAQEHKKEIDKKEIESCEHLTNERPEETIIESSVINSVKIEESPIDIVANYITKKKELKEQDNIEQNRWNDPLKQDPKFVTFKEMNDHYGLFLQRIQQQLSSVGGGGEVKFARLDDINSATVGTNKYLTYDQATKKFIFDTVDTGEGIYLDVDNAVALSVASANVLGGIKIGSTFTLDGSNRLQLNAATDEIVGGIKLGPGVTTNIDGQIIIDSEGLDFSFGDIAATTGTYPADYFEPARQSDDYAIMSSINANEDIVLASNGTGAVRVVGDFSVRRANGSLNGALEEQPIFRVKGDGQVQLLVPAADESEGAFTIVGGLNGVFQAPVNTGVMMHITGIASSPDPTPSRIYNDSQNSFGAFVTRRYNGTAASPTAVLDGEEIMRLSGTAHNGTIIPGTGNQRIVFKALGNQTLTNQGGAMEFWATPINTTTLAKIATVDSTGITLESGKVLTGNVTGNVSGTAATVTTAAQPAITSVGTLTSLTVTNQVSAKNYAMAHRDAGTIGEGGTLTVDFNTDGMIFFNITGSVTVNYTNIAPGREISLIVKNTSGTGRLVNLNVDDTNVSSGDATENLTNNKTGAYTIRSFGTTTATIYVETNRT